MGNVRCQRRDATAPSWSPAEAVGPPSAGSDGRGRHGQNRRTSQASSANSGISQSSRGHRRRRRDGASVSFLGPNRPIRSIKRGMRNRFPSPLMRPVRLVGSAPVPDRQHVPRGNEIPPPLGLFPASGRTDFVSAACNFSINLARSAPDCQTCGLGAWRGAPYRRTIYRRRAGAAIPILTIFADSRYRRRSREKTGR